MRWTIVCLLAGLAAVALAQELTVEQWTPRSTLVVEEHPVPRAKFPVIDVHSHHDYNLLEIPGALATVSQGITTIVGGQDGGQEYPLAEYFASLEETPVGPGRMISLLMGLTAALLASSSTMALAEYFDRSFSTSAQVERSLEVPVLVSIPRTRSASHQQLSRMYSA